MRSVTFVGLSADGTAIVVADSAGSEYRLDVDDRLSAALGLTFRVGQMEIPLHPLSPKDIQARVRAGASVAELAAESGEPVERIERFAGPPLADRAHTAGLARGCLVRGSDTTLDDYLTARLSPADAGSVRWDAWRRDDGRWVVLAALGGSGEQPADAVATWLFDPASRVVTVEDVSTLDLPQSGSGSGGLRLVGRDAAPAAQVVLLPSDDPTPDAAAAAQSLQDAPGSAAPADDRHDAREAARGSDSSTAATAPAAPAKQRRGRRASVPTWDEILFGAGSEQDTARD